MECGAGNEGWRSGDGEINPLRLVLPGLFPGES